VVNSLYTYSRSNRISLYRFYQVRAIDNNTSPSPDASLLAQFRWQMYNGGMVTRRSEKLSTRDNRIVRRLKLRLQEITPINRIVVFGSRARGDASPDSDLDVFMEVPNLDADLRREIREVAWEVSLDEGTLISTFVVTSAAITESPLGANPILRIIAKEGIAV
jgi:predicted nucleotidyltransferase